MRGALLEGTRAEMAVEALAIVEWLVQFYVFGTRFRSKIVNIEMMEAAELGFKRSEHRVVRVAGVTGLVRGDAMILKVGGGKIGRVVDVKALAVGFHDVAGETKGGALRTFHLAVHARHEAKERKKEEHAESENLAAGMRGDCGADHKNGSKQRAEEDQS